MDNRKSASSMHESLYVCLLLMFLFMNVIANVRIFHSKNTGEITCTIGSLKSTWFSPKNTHNNSLGTSHYKQRRVHGAPPI